MLVNCYAPYVINKLNRFNTKKAPQIIGINILRLTHIGAYNSIIYR